MNVEHVEYVSSFHPWHESVDDYYGYDDDDNNNGGNGGVRTEYLRNEYL